MGSFAHLSLGNLEVDWGKNESITNFSCLFSPEDKKLLPYEYSEDGETILVSKQNAYSRKLASILPRLELLGCTPAKMEREFLWICKKNGFTGHRAAKKFYNDFSRCLSIINVDNIKKSLNFRDNDDCQDVIRSVITEQPEFQSLLDITNGWHDFDSFLMFLNPLSLLRLLARNPANLEKDVVWKYADIVHGGYIKERDIYRPLSESSKFLLVAEGRSDIQIIGKGLKALFPEAADFFKLVDIEHYPWVGASNLHNFCRGLVSIGVQNKMILIFDNDAEGCRQYALTRKLPIPKNMRLMKLPMLPEFKKFRTKGPSGSRMENIGGKAVSIECFLDLQHDCKTRPVVRWTTYQKDSERYQGALDNKNDYVKTFLRGATIPKGYKTEKLSQLLRAIIAGCVAMPHQPSWDSLSF